MPAPKASSDQGKHPEITLVRELTWRYAIAIGLIASLSTAAWFSLHLVIAEQSTTAAVVNISGRQRMLCQRTALLSNMLIGASVRQRPEIRSRLSDAVSLMENSHQALMNGSDALHIPARKSVTVKAMYLDGPESIDRQMASYLHALKELLNAPDNQLDIQHPALKYISHAAAGPLLDSLNRMVSQYQLEGEQAIQQLSGSETALWLVTIILLVLEILLIFRPMTAHTRQAINQLQKLIAEQRRNEEMLEEMVHQRTLELEQQAHIDFLTQVNNRRHFMTLAEAELSRAKRYGTALSLFMIDIDWFKRVNDQFGHKAGDQVLQKMSQIIRETMRTVDIIGRIGGEEFSVILPDTDLPGALDVAERLRAAVASNPVPLDNAKHISITISLGVAQLASSEENVEELLIRADKALYLAKEYGRNRVVSAG